MKNSTFKNFIEWPRKIQSVFIFSINIIFFLILIVSINSKNHVAIARYSEKIDAIKNEMQKNKQFILNSKMEFEKNKKYLKKEISLNLPFLISKITLLSKEDNLTLNSINFPSPQKTESLLPQPIEVIASGNYFDILKFIRTISIFLPGSNFKNIILERKKEEYDISNNISVQIIISAYNGTRNEVKNKEPAGNNEIKNKRNPFEKIQNESVSSQINKNNINNYSIHTLKLIGTLSSPSEILAIIQDPSGFFYKTHKGELIGTEKACVTHINENEIILSFFENNENTRIILSNEDS